MLSAPSKARHRRPRCLACAAISDWASPETNAGLAGLLAVAACAAGACSDGKATLHMISFVGRKISYCFLVQRQFAQLLFHLERASWLTEAVLGPQVRRGIICFFCWFKVEFQLASIGGIGYRVSHQGQRGLLSFQLFCGPFGYASSP